MRVLGPIRENRLGSSSLSASAGAVILQGNTSMAAAAAAAVPAAQAAAAEPAGPGAMQEELQSRVGEEGHLGRGHPCQERKQRAQRAQQAPSLSPMGPGAYGGGGDRVASSGAECPPPACAMCGLGREAQGALGKLLPFDCSASCRKGGQRRERVHLLCAAWSPRAHWAGNDEVRGPTSGQQKSGAGESGKRSARTRQGRWPDSSPPVLPRRANRTRRSLSTLVHTQSLPARALPPRPAARLPARPADGAGRGAARPLAQVLLLQAARRGHGLRRARLPPLLPPALCHAGGGRQGGGRGRREHRRGSCARGRGG